MERARDARLLEQGVVRAACEDKEPEVRINNAQNRNV